MYSGSKQRIRQFIVDTFMVGKPIPFADEDSFLGLGIFDSTAVLELISWIEEEYGIQVAEGELVPENFDSINNVAAYLEGKLNGKPASEVASGVAPISQLPAN